MSFLCKKSANLTRTACKILNFTPCISQTNQIQMLSHNLARHADSMSHVSYFRNMWTMCEKATSTAHRKPMNISCIKRGAHTEGDKELSDFLQKEIQLEQSTSKYKSTLPDIKGFKVTTDGCNIVFTKASSDEKLVVKFNVNHSVDADEPLQMEGKQDADEVTHFVSKPPFTVEFTKGGNHTLSLHCNFPGEEDFLDEENPQDQGKNEETFTDQFEIEEVTLHSGEVNDTIYTMGADTMDGMLYDLLMDMMDERGINDEFIEALVDYSTTYEHKQYVSFLSDLKSFVEK